MSRFTNNRKVFFSNYQPSPTYQGDHVYVINDYDPILKDYLKRDFAISVKLNSVMSMGYPHSFNEQKAIPHNTKAINPKRGFASEGNAPTYRPPSLDANYSRNNWKHCFPRCYVTGIRYEQFDREMAMNYSAFGDLIAKDTNDMMVDFAKTTANDFWNGKTPMDKEDVDASDDTLSYTGILSQITDVSAIAAGTNISDAIITKMTNMMARLDYDNYPDVIVMNPATWDIMRIQEMNRPNASINIDINQTELVPGMQVKGINTPMGTLPVLLEPFVKPDGNVHSIVCLNTSMIDRVWMFNDGPRIYEIANPDAPYANDRLLTDKFVLDYANFILHGADTGAHFNLTYEAAV